MVIILINIATHISLLDFIPVLTEQNVSTADNHTNITKWIDLPNNTRIEFIHIGKTGGVTIVKSFKLARKKDEVTCIMAKLRVNATDDISSCNTNRAKDSKIYNHTIGHYHMYGANKHEERREGLVTSQFKYVPLYIT